MVDFVKAEELITGGKFQQAVILLNAKSPELLDEEAFARLEGCIAQLPDGFCQSSPEGCYLAFSAALRRGKTRIARQWYGQLVNLRDSCRENTRERAILAQWTCRAGIQLPQTDNAQILLLLSILHNDMVNYKLPSYSLCVTGRRPSVLRGAKDLSEWGKNYRAVANIVRSLQESVLPDGGTGAVSAAIAELLYERGDLNAASVEVAATLSSQDPEIAFAGYAQLARIARLDGIGSGRPEDVLQKLGALLEEWGASSLMPNYRALCIRFDIHNGRLDTVRQWLEACSVDGLTSCCLANAYELMTQAQALIALGRCREALTLLESLLLVYREDIRPLDAAECLVCSAVACELLGSRDLALDRLEEALQLAAPYRYIRVIADGGKVIFHLMGALMKESHSIQTLSASYLQQILEAAKTYSMLFPLLYSQDLPLAEKPECIPDLTPAELQVLQMMSTGRSNQQIGEQLSVKLATVKFHIANIFEKLGAKNRVEAVEQAKRYNIL